MKRLMRKANGIQALYDVVNNPALSTLMDYMGPLLNPDTDTLDAVKSTKELKDNLEYIKMYGRDFFNRLLGLKSEINDAQDAVTHVEEYKQKYTQNDENLFSPTFAYRKTRMKRIAELQPNDIENIQTNQIIQTLDYPLITQLLYKTREVYNHLLQLNEQETQDEIAKLEQLIGFYQSILDSQDEIPQDISKIVDLQQDIVNYNSQNM